MPTFGDLKAQIAAETLRSDLLPEIGDAIRAAIRRYQGTRFWFNERTYWTNTAPGDPIITPPSDLATVDLLECVSNGHRYRLRPVSYQQFRCMAGTTADLGETSSTTGEPTDWAQYRRKLLLYPTPDAVYRLWLSYVSTLDPLDDDSANAWTEEAQDLIKAAAKRILYVDVIDDLRRAEAMQAQEAMALRALLQESIGRTATGRGRLRSMW